MLLTFSNSKNGSLNCSLNNKFFHSNYNPENEALKFVQLLNYNYKPEIILITEPALSYCAKFLKEKFKSSKIIAIRFCNDFKEYDHYWDDVIYFAPDTVEEILETYITEENFSSCVFLSWKNSENIFTDKAQIFWKILKNYLKIKHDILNTKNYFSSRWLKNTFNNCLTINKTSILQKGNKPVLIVASGTSLKQYIDKIKENRNSFFLICVSSALSVMPYNKIIPDLCITTDGGYWAKKHLENFNQTLLKQVTFTFPYEANIPYSLIKNNTIIPLDYEDSFSTILLNKLHIKALNAVRNGTVSGTAIDFALSVTDEPVGVIGLDLCNSKTYSHTQPNALELISSTKDNKLNPLCTRLYKSEINTASLKIYAQWFNKQKQYTNKVFRIYENLNENKNISSIKTINFDEYLKLIQTNKKENKFNYLTDESNSFKLKNETLVEILKDLKQRIIEAQNFESINKDKYLYTFLDSSTPGELMLYKKYNSNEYLEKLKDKNLKIINKYLDRIKR